MQKGLAQCQAFLLTAQSEDSERAALITCLVLPTRDLT